ncbi:isoprenylcysteine carboxylmethyltransferase family protein [Fulvimarina sp. MAC8]|uniref:methyltransferase family protein n=1 Tax=Fulvimarina sp. MAC8 TaxID=3162874 RepID=UPI0032EF911E
MALHTYQRRRRMALALALLAAIIGLLFVGSSQSERMHEMVEAVGLGFIVLGIAGRIWCTLYIGGRKAREIVDLGPYSVSRNPLYVFSTIAAGGVGAQSGSITIAVLAAAACALAFHFVILREERFLTGEFGSNYRSYLGRVPRFWPNPRLFSDANELIVKPRRVYSTLADGLVFFAAMPILEIVEWAQHDHLIEIVVRLP